MTDALIIDAARSPRGKGKETGALHNVHPQRILAQVLNAVRDRNGFDTADVDDVVMGCNAGSGDHSMDIARMSALDAGWSLEAPGVTLNRFCGSGQQAVNFGAMGIRAGFQDLVVAGGVESMSRGAPMHVDGFTANNAHLREQYDMVAQGISADLIATIEGFTREECDALAAESQARAEVAIKEGRFDRALVPIHHDDGTLALDHEEFPRPGTTAADLASLKPSFAGMGAHVPKDKELTIDQTALLAYPEVSEIVHVHHAGNSSGVVDGAAAVLLASPEYAAAQGWKPRARVVMTAVAGTEPVIMLTAPGPAATLAVKKAGMTFDDIDLFEVNEAFAAVVLKFFKDTGVDPAKVNVNGGAMALGHPIGATGGMLVGTLLDELERRDLQTGLVAMCTGGGMGTATIIERVQREIGFGQFRSLRRPTLRPRAYRRPMVVTIEDVRALAMTLPRAYEALVRDRVKFRVGRIVFLAFSRDETLMGFGFPKEEREALVASDPLKFLMPEQSDMRYNWVVVRLDKIDDEEMRELVLDAWRMCVPKRVAAEYDGEG